jgi:uncharacterized damage-inducible protein DinB
MKSIIRQLAGYNVWANDMILKTIVPLPAEMHLQKMESSYGSLLDTVMHLADAGSIWWQRLKLSEKLIIPGKDFSGGMNEAAVLLMQQDKQWLDWMTETNERMMEHEFIYLNSKKEQVKQPVYQVLLHVFNHATYHRGQLVNMLRQLGIQKIPATDFTVFTRKK